MWCGRKLVLLLYSGIILQQLDVRSVRSIKTCLTHRGHGVDGYISCAGLQLKRVARVEVSHRRVRHGSTWALGLDCVALRGSLGSQWPTVELGFLEISLWGRRGRRRRVVGLGARCGLHVQVLGYVRVLHPGEVWRGLHCLTARVIQTWEIQMRRG